MNTDTTAPQTLLDAITSRDASAMEGALTPEAILRALLPSGAIEVRGSSAIAARFHAWFGAAPTFVVLDASTTPIADLDHVSYRARVRQPDATTDTVIEQHLICSANGTAVETIDLVCTGFRPIPELNNPAARFDAGSLGCGDGLAAGFKQRIAEIDVGDLLSVRTIDPSAKEDLPSLARLLGHTIHSTEDHADGGLTITVERGR